MGVGQSATAEQEEGALRCIGLNYVLSAGNATLFIKRTFFPGRIIEIPITDVTSIHLESKSIFPPLAIALAATISGLFIWGYVGGWAWPIRLPKTYEPLLFWMSLVIALGLADMVFRYLFASLKIEAKSVGAITIRVTRTSDAARLVERFRVLRA